jgi:DNA-binding transcriptional LysR family regulator
MQVETFKVYCDLVETASFSKAAAINGITQSAVSQQIRALEIKFGVTLIDRGRRHFALTPEGEAFLESARDIVAIYENLDARLHELQDVIAGDIRIAAIYSIGLHELPPFLKDFRKQYPEVDVHVDYVRSAQVYTAVSEGQVDMGLVSYPTKRNGMQIEPFMQDTLVLICPPSHPLAKRKHVKLDDINGEKFISFEPDLPTRKVIDRYLRERGVAVTHTMEFDNIETVKRAVEIENGISIVPLTTVTEEVEGGTLAAVEIREPQMTRPLGILLKRNRSRSPALKKLVALLQKNPNNGSPEAADAGEQS